MKRLFRIMAIGLLMAGTISACGDKSGGGGSPSAPTSKSPAGGGSGGY